MASGTGNSLAEGLSCLSRVLGSIQDDFFAGQVRLSVQMLSSEVETVTGSPNPRTVKGLAFSLNDLMGMASELSAEDQAQMEPCFAILRGELARLQTEFTLPQETVEGLRALRTKLTERRSVHEKQIYRPPGTVAAPLPHEPASMQQDAALLQKQIESAGFESAALGRVAADPSSFEPRDVIELIDEINEILE